MTSGFRVVCSDGQIRHESLFQSRQDALAWMTWHTGHHLCWKHTIRREAEWEVAAMRIRRRPSFPSKVRELAEGTPTEITVDLTDRSLASAGGVTVGIGVSPHRPHPQEASTDSPSSPTLVPASYRTVLSQAYGKSQERTVRDPKERTNA